jgi:hypothetical protein
MATALDTIQIVRSHIKEEPVEEVLSTRIDHLKRLATVTNDRDLLARFRQDQTNKDTIAQLRNRGFTLFVDDSIVKRFAYCASILGGSVIGYHLDDPYGIRYAGDIPDFALDRISSARTVLIYMTIHSTQPLPVKIVHCDPVVIGWLDRPTITRVGVIRKHWQAKSPLLGVIVAMWDMDKEITLEEKS